MMGATMDPLRMCPVLTVADNMPTPCAGSFCAWHVDGPEHNEITTDDTDTDGGLCALRTIAAGMARFSA